MVVKTKRKKNDAKKRVRHQHQKEGREDQADQDYREDLEGREGLADQVDQEDPEDQDLMGDQTGVLQVEDLGALACLPGDPREAGPQEVLPHPGGPCLHPGLCREAPEVQVCRHGVWLHLLVQAMLPSLVSGQSTQRRMARDIITTGRPRSPSGRNHRS